METSNETYNHHQERESYEQPQVFEPFNELFEVNDNYMWPSNPNAEPYGAPVQCFLYHKVRGGKGEWKEIVQHDMIRVTKGVGKKVKLVVKSTINFKVNELQLSLQDLAEGTKPSRVQENIKDKPTKFHIENTNMKQDGNRTIAEIFIKLFKLSKQLVFQVTIVKEGASYPGQTVLFGTHNSGKQSKRKEKDEDKDERKRLDEEHMFDRRVGYEHPSLAQPYNQKNLVNRSAAAMKNFGNKVIAHEARKRNSSFVVYVACKKLKRSPEDFTTFVYKNENLLHQEAVSLGASMGRAIFLQGENGDYNGSYTLVAAIRSRNQADAIPPGEGVAALFDFRGENDSMKLIPIQPVLLSSDQTNVWLIGSFVIDGVEATWVQSSHVAQPHNSMGISPIVGSPMYPQMHPSKIVSPVQDQTLYMNSRPFYATPHMSPYHYVNKPSQPYLFSPQYYSLQKENPNFPMYHQGHHFFYSSVPPNDFRQGTRPL